VFTLTAGFYPDHDLQAFQGTAASSSHLTLPIRNQCDFQNIIQLLLFKGPSERHSIPAWYAVSKFDRESKAW
jgi:hypothetical protein